MTGDAPADPSSTQPQTRTLGPAQGALRKVRLEGPKFCSRPSQAGVPPLSCCDRASKDLATYAAPPSYPIVHTFGDKGWKASMPMKKELSKRAGRGAGSMEPGQRARSLLGSVVEQLVVAGAYLLFGRLGLMLDPVSGFAALVWPPTGIALAALLLRGLRVWPAIFIAAAVTNLWIGASLWVALGLAIGNLLEALVAAYVLVRFVRFRKSLKRLRDVVGLTAVAFGSALMSATIGLVVLRAAGLVLPSQEGFTLAAGWLGDALGSQVLAPFLLCWSDLKGRGARAPGGVLEALGLMLFTTAVYFIFFLGPIPFTYMLFPPMIWAAIRFGPKGATAMVLAISIISIWATAEAFGPFVQETLALSLFSLQAYMAVVSLTSLLLAAAMAERREALLAREKLLAIVSHDLKNPLNSIQLSAAHLLRQPLEEFGPRPRRQAEAIMRAAGYIGDIVRNLLDEASIRAGGLSVKKEPQDLTELVKEAAELAASALEHKSQTLRMELPQQLKVFGDRVRILEVLSNLLGNATKFTPENGTITVRVAAKGGQAECCVSDTGSGIEREQLEQVFEPFQTRNSDRGTGLGLAIVRGIVEAHGGRVWLRSKIGGGTTVGFTLALADGAERKRFKLRWRAKAPKALRWSPEGPR